MQVGFESNALVKRGDELFQRAGDTMQVGSISGNRLRLQFGDAELCAEWQLAVENAFAASMRADR